MAACGDDGSTPADAPPSDGSPDAPVDSAPTTVSLTLLWDGLPVADVDAYFQNPDGSLAAKVATNASGVATAMVQNGGSVTVVDPFATPSGPAFGIRWTDVRTIAGIKLGDQLVISEGAPSDQTSVNITLPANSNAVDFEINTTCGGDTFANTTATLVLYGCNGTADFLVIAIDEAGDAIGSFYKPGVTVTNGANVNLSTETYASIPGVTFAYTNIPAAFDSVGVLNALTTQRGPLLEIETLAELNAGAGSVTRQRALANGTTSIVKTRFENAAQSFSEHEAIAWAPTTASFTFDGTDRFLPSFTQAPTYAEATRQLSWVTSGSTVQPEFVNAELTSRRQSPELAWKWQLAAPYTGASVTYPMLPSEIASYIPIAGDTLEISELSHGKAPGGYDAIRPMVFTDSGPAGAAASFGASGEMLSVALNTDIVDGGTAKTRPAKRAALKRALRAR